MVLPLILFSSKEDKMSDKKDATMPIIIPSVNGPYIYIYDFKPKEVKGLTNSKGQKLSNVTSASFCRCGQSENKPFCDGTHMKIQFSDRKETDGHVDKRMNYEAVKITIHDNRGICAHAGFCTGGLPSVFKLGEEPWIDASGASIEEIIETINKCPSGALSYSIEGIEHRDQNRKPAVVVSKDGPYYITGGIQIMGYESRAEEVSNEHCTLCRCGSSKNKPFCDGTHWDIGFKDEKN
jgi:CDGSH-type Zn-finger protein